MPSRHSEREEESPDAPFGYVWKCRRCGDAPVLAEWQDTGIGAYEYWGARGVDKRIELLSICCGGDVVVEDPPCSDDDSEG
jgi:hypothetical protein